MGDNKLKVTLYCQVKEGRSLKPHSLIMDLKKDCPYRNNVGETKIKLTPACILTDEPCVWGVNSKMLPQHCPLNNGAIIQTVTKV